MSLLAKPTPAPTPRTKDAARIALFYAGVLVVLVLTQLFTYEEFIQLIVSMNFPFGLAFDYFTAAFIVAAEVFALPFLIRMPLSRAFRWVSMVSGWLVAAIWLKTSVWLVVTEPPVDSVGFLGTLIPTMPGWWAIFVSIAFGILAVWASWGMWPTKRKK